VQEAQTRFIIVTRVEDAPDTLKNAINRAARDVRNKPRKASIAPDEIAKRALRDA
jgi:hypothetical protein